MYKYKSSLNIPFNTNMSSDKAVVDSEPVAFTNEEAKQILHQFAKEIGSFEFC